MIAPNTDKLAELDATLTRGSRVTWTDFHGDGSVHRAEIERRFSSPLHDTELLMAEITLLADGSTRMVPLDHLDPAPRFEVGQRVALDGTPGTVVHTSLDAVDVALDNGSGYHGDPLPLDEIDA